MMSLVIFVYGYYIGVRLMRIHLELLKVWSGVIEVKVDSFKEIAIHDNDASKGTLFKKLAKRASCFEFFNYTINANDKRINLATVFSTKRFDVHNKAIHLGAIKVSCHTLIISEFFKSLVSVVDIADDELLHNRLAFTI
jgi:hypothetical protein